MKMNCGVILLGLAATVLVAVPWMCTSSDFHYFEKRTGVRFPNGSKSKKSWSAVAVSGGVLRLPKDKVKSFLDDYHFRPMSDMVTPEDIIKDSSKILEWNPLHTPDVFNHRKGYPAIGTNLSLMYLRSERSEKYPWEILVDPRVGQLWVLVFNADFAGD